MIPAIHRHAAFGLRWDADVPIAAFDRVAGEGVETGTGIDAVAVRRVDRSACRVPVRDDASVFADGFRFAWRDEATFDVHDGTRVDYCPGPGWTGSMPVAFASTVAALTLAWRGALPCHASAVAVDGRAVLIAGDAGAGKSTLTAHLLADGATLIGDDLSVVTCASADAPFVVAWGRPDIRLHRDTAAAVPASSCEPVPGDDRGKWLVRPLARSAPGALPLAGFVMLGAPAGRLAKQHAATLVGRHLFRPRWLRALPGQADRLRAVLAIADRLPCHGLAPAAPVHRDPAAAVDEARRAVAAILRG